MQDNLIREYDPRECIVFRKTDEAFGGLSNMAPGYPIRIAGITFLTSEALYQACRFPHIPELQDQIIREKSPMTAKMRIKRYLSDSRDDWDSVRVRVMTWCLRVKLAQNFDKFSKLLEATGDRPIVESSRKDPFWGALEEKDGTLRGANVLGRLLMQLRENLRSLPADQLRRPAPPGISRLWFLGRALAPDPTSSNTIDISGLVHLDAATFQGTIDRLAETLANKVDREGRNKFQGAQWTVDDIYVQLRVAKNLYDLIFYINADENRRSATWREEYSILAWSHIRGLIDCLYNVSLLMQDPERNGFTFRLSGLKKFIKNVEELEEYYGNKPEWRRDLENRKQIAERIAMELGISIEAARNSKQTWKTLGRYLGESYGAEDELQHFLRRFTLGQWSDYSSIAHATYEGLVPHAAFFIRDGLDQSQRKSLEDIFPRMMSMHVARAAMLMLCIITEVQAKFSFDGAGINKRIEDAWKALLPMYEVEEFYSARYRSIIEKLQQGSESEQEQLAF